MLKSEGEKRAVAIIAVVAVLFVAVVGSLVAALTVGHQKTDRPYIQVAAGNDFVQVSPSVWCDVSLTECDPAPQQRRPPTRLPVAVGDTVWLSLSSELAKGPWRLIAQYLTPAGPVADDRYFGPGTTFSYRLTSTRDRTLIAFEVQAPSRVQTGNDEFLIRGYFGVDTTPTGLHLPS